MLVKGIMCMLVYSLCVNMIYNICLCLDLILRMRNPFFPNRKRLTYYHFVAFLVPLFFVYILSDKASFRKESPKDLEGNYFRTVNLIKDPFL
jgi:hypothetical protein